MVKAALNDRFYTRIFWAFLLITLIPWLFLRSQQATHSDILWLTEALQRVLAGGKMSEEAFEVNPPLSMVIYILPVLAKSFLNVPLHYAVLIQTLLLTALSTLAVYKILNAWKMLQAADINVLCAGYLLAVTILSSIYFGERDHLLALGLVPFVLIQASLTFNLPRPKGWTIPVLSLGAILILLKPHHGLLPTILLAHRAISQRRISVIFDPDFLSLAAAVLAYLALIFFAFPDYASIVFPDVFRLYLQIGSLDFIFSAVAFFTLSATGIFFLLPFLKMPLRENYLVLFLTLCGLIGLIPFVVQKMGFFYHLIPSIAFFSMVIALSFFYAVKLEVKGNFLRLLMTLPSLIFLTILFTPREFPYPNHHFFQGTDFAKLVSTCPDGQDCSFFLFNRDMGIMHEISYYTGIPHISRFPSLWFLPAIMTTEKNLEKGESGPLSEDELNMYFNRYARMLADDIDKNKPFHLIIWDWEDFGPDIGFMEYFKRDPAFNAAISPYRQTGTLAMDYKDYYLSYESPNGKSTISHYTLYERR